MTVVGPVPLQWMCRCPPLTGTSSSLVPDGRGASDVVVGLSTVVTGIVVVVVIAAAVAAVTLSEADGAGAICEEVVTFCEDEVPHAVMPAAMTAAAVHPASWRIGVRRVCEVVMLLRVIRVTDGLLTVD